MKLSMKLTFAAVTIVALGGGFLAGQWSQSRQISALALRIADTERQLASLQQGDRAGGLYRPARPGAIGPVYMHGRPSAKDPRDAGSPPTATEAAAKRLQAGAAMERDYASEPMDPRWAGTTTQLIQDAIVDVAAGDAPMPEAAQVDCRSRTCRIDLTLKDGAEVGMFTDNLLVGLAGKLPNARMVERPSRDGRGMTVSIYASKPY